MYDLSVVVEKPAIPSKDWHVPPREESIEHIASAVLQNRIIFVTGPRGAGKSNTASQAVERAVCNSGAPKNAVYMSRLLGQIEPELLALDQQCVLMVENVETLPESVLEALCSAIQDNGVTAVIECFDLRALPEGLKRLSHLVRTETCKISELSELETFEYLTQKLGGPVVAESAYLIWYYTRGNQELLAKWTPALYEAGHLSKGEFAWYWNGQTATSPEVDQLIARQFNRLNKAQQGFVETLALAGSLPRGAVAEAISDTDLLELQASGFVREHQENDLSIYIRLSSQLWSELMRGRILPGRRHEIFKNLTKPAAGTRDFVAALSWAVSALQDGYTLSDEDLLAAAQASYLQHRWDLLEVFVDLRFPSTTAPELLAEGLKDVGPERKSSLLTLLIWRAMGYHKASKHHSALVDLDLAESIVGHSPETLGIFYASISTVRGHVLRGLPDSRDQLTELYAKELERQERMSNPYGYQRIQVESMGLPPHGSDPTAHLAALEEMFSKEESFGDYSLSVLAEYIYLLALSGQLARAVDVADKALAKRALRDPRSAEHEFPWAYAEIVCARYLVLLWSGNLSPAVESPDMQASINLIESAVYQAGVARALALMGYWDASHSQFLGSLQRFKVSDPLGRIKFAMAGYIQTLAATGSKGEVLKWLAEYDDTPFKAAAILETDCDYLVLTASFAVGAPDFPQRLKKAAKTALAYEHWFSLIKIAHLGVVATTGAAQDAYFELLLRSAEHVDRAIAKRFVVDAEAIRGDSVTEKANARASLVELGIWVPQPQVSVHLTKRQREIADLIVRGFTNKEIAAKLVLSVRTVDAHVSSILGRSGLHDRKALSGYLRSLDR